jgi:hypothetical protein
MSVADERFALADRAVRQAFEQSSVAWRVIPQWNVGDPGCTRVRMEVTSRLADLPVGEGPLPSESVAIETASQRFRVTLAQATSATPDALVTAAGLRAVALAQGFDQAVLTVLRTPAVRAQLAGGPGAAWWIEWPAPRPGHDGANAAPRPRRMLDVLLEARALLEDSGYRAPSCLLASTAHFADLNRFAAGVIVTPSLLTAANANTLQRSSLLDDNGQHFTLVLGRLREIAPGMAAQASAGEEPVDIAVCVPPSLELIGETSDGEIEFAVRIRYAVRFKDERGVVVLRS